MKRVSVWGASPAMCPAIGDPEERVCSCSTGIFSSTDGTNDQPLALLVAGYGVFLWKGLAR